MTICSSSGRLRNKVQRTEVEMARKASTVSTPENNNKVGLTGPLEKQLAEFEQKCVKDFDVSWVLQQFRPEQNTPEWLRKILTLMLLGWAFKPLHPEVRISMAWHQMNRHLRRLMNAVLMDVGDTELHIAFVASLMHKRKSHIRVFAALGGFTSFRMLSRSDSSAWLAGSAEESSACFIAVNIITLIHEKKFAGGGKTEPSFNTALHILERWIKAKVTPRLKDEKKAELYRLLLNPEYGLDVPGMSPSTIQSSWTNCRVGIEFLVAFLTLKRGSDWNPIRQSTNISLQGDHLNAYNYIAAGKYHHLPLNDPNFQDLWLRRAKYFSNILDKRDIPALAQRFQGFSESPVNFELVLVDELQAAEMK